MSRFVEAPVNNQNKDVLALLTMLSNPEDLRQKLEEMTRREKELDERIALAGEADQILTLRKNCEIMQADAAKLLEEARLEAQSIKIKAQDEANKLSNQSKKDFDNTSYECMLLKKTMEDEIRRAREVVEAEKAQMYQAIQEERATFANQEQALSLRSQELEAERERLNQLGLELQMQEVKVRQKATENETLLNDLMEWQTDLQTLCASWKQQLGKIIREQ